MKSGLHPIPPHPDKGAEQQRAVIDYVFLKIKTKLNVTAQHPRNRIKGALGITLSVTGGFP